MSALRVMKTARSLEQCGKLRQFFRRSPHQAEKEKLSNRIQEYYGLEEQYVEIEIAGGEGPVDLSPDSGRDSLYSGISGGQ